jgi:hypothetical protein
VCGYFVPHAITREISLQGAGDVCRNNFIQVLYNTTGSAALDIITLEDAEDFIKGEAGVLLNPGHALNVVSTLFSLVCFLLWAYLTPHCSITEAGLDQKRKSHLQKCSLPFPPPFLPLYITYRYIEVER